MRVESHIENLRLGVHSRVLPREHPDAPKYWMRETGGELAKAVKTYLERERQHDPLSIEHIRLLRMYFVQWIDSPAWRGPPVAELRAEARMILSVVDIDRWVEKATEHGMDPL